MIFLSTVDWMEVIGLFILLYPLGMSIVWTVGTIMHYIAKERKVHYSMNEQPLVSILIPAYNEMENIHNVVDKMHKMNFSNFEIIVINDGSSDRTVEVVESIMGDYSRLRFVNSVKNKGKAHALHMGLLASQGEYIVGVDADSYLDPDAIIHLIAPMLAENNGLQVGAVTGNPRVRNRVNIVVKLQTAEYSSVVGMIKRSQQMNRTCMTVSGVCVAYCKSALLDVGLWDKDIIAEDIAVTWQLHEAQWGIIYNPRTVCWMLVPEKLPSLFKQRVRWSQGGIEVLFRHLIPTIKRGDFRNMILFFEQIIGIVWAFAFIITAPINLYKFFVGDTTFAIYQMKVLIFISVFNFLIAFWIDKRYDHGLFGIYIWIIWYPLVYWIFNVFVVINGFFKTVAKAFKKEKVQHTTWESPDRGSIKTFGIVEEDLIQQETNEMEGVFLFPVTILLWIMGIFVFYQTFKNILDAFLREGATLTFAISSNIEFEYLVFIGTAAIIALLLFYILFVIIPFPQLKKHTQRPDNDKATQEYFNVDDLKKYQKRRKVVIEEDNELNLL